LGKATGAAQQRIEPRIQFFELERLDHIIVRTRCQPFDLVLPIATRSEDQDRKRLAPGAQLANQFQAAKPRQAQVNHRQVMVELLGLVQRLFGIGHRFDHMATFCQTGLQVMAQQRLIFNHQQFHRALPSQSASLRTCVLYSLATQ